MNPNVRRHATLFLISAMTAFTAASARAATEEQKLAKIARNLKPINDSQWNEIAGTKITDTYDIQKSDTLWDISKRLFGNSYYWPKVWAINAGISNPHVVSPGQKLVFNSGSSESAPKLAPSTATDAPSDSPMTAAAAAATSASASPTVNNGELREYDKLPPGLYARQRLGAPTDTTHYDELGLDKEMRIAVANHSAFRVPGIANDTTVPYLGEIVSSRRDGVGLAQHETVFLKSNSQDLQVGTTYTIFGEADLVHERKSDRSGYLYRSLGEVKIVGVKDENYIGVISAAYDVIKRGMKVYPLLPLVTDMKPLAARSAIESLVLVSEETGTRNTAQFRYIHFDRGIEDGVQIGNVFRVYDYYDPVTKAKISDSDFLVNADAIVVHATAQFSTAIVLRSSSTFTRGDFAVLLTDVSDLEKQIRASNHSVGGDAKKTVEDKELDELDELDKTSGEGLGKKEEAEIKELDQWDKTKNLKDDKTEPTMPSAADTPTDEAEKLPGSETETPAKKAPPQDPTLDQTLDSPTVTPGLETKEPPAHLRKGPEQTLEAPPPPTTSEEPAIPGQASPGMSAEPMTPDAPPVEPALPTPGDEVRTP